MNFDSPVPPTPFITPILNHIFDEQGLFVEDCDLQHVLQFETVKHFIKTLASTFTENKKIAELQVMAELEDRSITSSTFSMTSSISLYSLLLFLRTPGGYSFTDCRMAYIKSDKLADFPFEGRFVVYSKQNNKKLSRAIQQINRDSALKFRLPVFTYTNDVEVIYKVSDNFNKNISTSYLQFLAIVAFITDSLTRQQALDLIS